MKAKELRRKLKNIPANTEIYMYAHDQPEWCPDGTLQFVSRVKKQDVAPGNLDLWEQESFDSMPDEWVCLHG